MTESTSAKVRINLREGIFDLDGPTEFVAQQLERFHGIIEQALTRPQPMEALDAKSISTDDRASNHSVVEAPSNDGGYKQHFGLPKEQVAYVVDVGSGGTIKVINSFKSPTKVEQQRKLSLVYCLAKEFLTPGVVVAAEELRDLCRQHACYDSNNFAGNLKDATTWFITTGGGRGKEATYKLTTPGRDEARRLIQGVAGVPA